MKGVKVSYFYTINVFSDTQEKKNDCPYSNLKFNVTCLKGAAWLKSQKVTRRGRSGQSADRTHPYISSFFTTCLPYWDLHKPMMSSVGDEITRPIDKLLYSDTLNRSGCLWDWIFSINWVLVSVLTDAMAQYSIQFLTKTVCILMPNMHK